MPQASEQRHSRSCGAASAGRAGGWVAADKTAEVEKKDDVRVKVPHVFTARRRRSAAKCRSAPAAA
eukprot:1844973-Prymnesium_polylepis.1